MFKNFTKQSSITTYGNGLQFLQSTGFEQVVINNTATYYVIDSQYSTPSIVIEFHQNWTFSQAYTLSTLYTYSLKYVLGFFYTASAQYFTKTGSNFGIISQHSGRGGYWGIYYDNNTSLFYVVSYANTCIDVFDTNTSFLNTISLTGYPNPYSINQLNGELYVGISSSAQVLVLQNNTISNVLTINSCLGVYSIYFANNGYMLTACFSNNIATISNLSGVSQNISISTSMYPTVATVDSQGRLIVISVNQVDIYN